MRISEAITRLIRAVAERDKERDRSESSKWGYFGSCYEQAVDEAERDLEKVIDERIYAAIERARCDPRP